ncbi:MAG: 1-acyl-sn-glycerol-3-phosphate acyltransferase [Candidatus Omnitrophica bacterium]|nr:1-acyl-sn-glycerol-3-phosphate acyltransferase [Candidatus Omnitrophota bacterium]
MKKRNNFYIFCRFLLFIIFKMLFFFKSSGRENLPEKGGCIIASNHLSYLDPIVLSIASPRMLTFMAKQELFKNPFFSRLITALNSFPLERGSADLKSIRFAINKLKSDGTLIIFPEGTRSTSGQINEGQSGVSMLAAKANVPVVPTLIKGTDIALAAGSKKIRFFVPLSVHFGKLMYFKPSSSKDNLKDEYHQFSRDIIAEIQKLKSIKSACKA